MTAKRRALTVFDGLSSEDLLAVTEGLERRRVPAGATMTTQGERVGALYVIQTGTADVLITDRQGREHPAAQLGRGGVVGEMSLLTGEPASATVRAATDLDVLVVSARRFREIALAFPRIYENVAIMVSEKLDANRRYFFPEDRKLVLLEDAGAPPTLGYALACSLAWHTRESVLLAVLADGEPAPELMTLAQERGDAEESPGAHIRLVDVRQVGLDDLTEMLDELAYSFEHVLVQQVGEPAEVLRSARTVRVAGPEYLGSPPSGNGPDGPVLVGWVDEGAASGPDREGLVRVPMLAAADEQGLRAGLLPGESSAGRALGRVARDLAGLAVGVVLSAGGPVGYAYVGALRILEESALPVDYLVGTGIGALIAAARADGRGLDETGELVREAGEVLWTSAIGDGHSASESALQGVLRRTFGETRLEDLKVPLAIVAGDLRTGQEVVFRSGLVWPAVLAALSIPGFHPAQEMGPYLLVDGGIVNPRPSSVAADLGADVILALSPPGGDRPGRVEASSTEAVSSGQSSLEVVLRSLEIMQSRLSAEPANRVVLPLEIPVRDLALPAGISGSRERELVELGGGLARDALSQLAPLLPWMSR